MGYLDRFVRNDSYLNATRNPFWHNAGETAGYAGFSYLAGRINTQYGDRAKIKGHDATYVAALAGKAATLAMDFLGVGGMGWGYEGLNIMSNAFLSAHFCAKGAQDGMAAAAKAASAQRALPAPSGSALPGGAGQRTAVTGTSLGAIPQAPQPGRYLDLNKTAAIAAM